MRTNFTLTAGDVVPVCPVCPDCQRRAGLLPDCQRQRVKVYPPLVVELLRANRQRLAFPIYPTSKRQGGDAGDVVTIYPAVSASG